MLEKEITLDCLPAQTTAPTNLTPAEQIAWYQEQLTSIAPVRQYIAFCEQQIEATWQLLQTHLITTQRSIATVEVLPSRKPREATVKAKSPKSLLDLVKASKFSDAEKAMIMAKLGLTE